MAKSKNLNLTFTPTKSVRKGTQASAYVLNPDNLGEGNKMAGQAQAIIATLVKLAESTGSLTVTRELLTETLNADPSILDSVQPTGKVISHYDKKMQAYGIFEII